MSLKEEEALLSEMDVTGQAFEDMQEQNSRLLQQLREKDDANFKLMSERIKSNQIYKLLKEEKEELADQVLTFKTQVSGTFYAARVTFVVPENCDVVSRCRCCASSGRRTTAGRTEAGRKRGRPPEHAGHPGKRARCTHTSAGTEQEEGEKRHGHQKDRKDT